MKLPLHCLLDKHHVRPEQAQHLKAIALLSMQELYFGKFNVPKDIFGNYADSDDSDDEDERYTYRLEDVGQPLDVVLGCQQCALLGDDKVISPACNQLGHCWRQLLLKFLTSHTAKTVYKLR